MPPIDYRNRWAYFTALFLCNWALYFGANRQTVLPAHALPLSFVDRATPFLPWTGWVYVTVFLMPLLPCLAVREDRDVRELVVSFSVMTGLCSFVFLVYPTVYPRPALDAGWPAGGPLSVVRFFDTAKNCFPSQHVAAAFLSAFYIRRFLAWWGWAAVALAAAIAVSTLTTKQHYLWDVLAGCLVSGAAYRARRL